MADPSLAELFETGSDSDLCGRLVNRIYDVHGDDVSAAALSDEERTVHLAWLALGVIGNGGFRYLFEKPIVGDPHYALTRLAFEAIGCWDAVEAFDRAFARFPDGRPPTESMKRLKQYNRRLERWPAPEDLRFFRADPTVEACLARWVRARPAAYRHLCA
jgi:hypothetical protein